MKKVLSLFALLVWATTAQAQLTLTVSAATDNGTGAANTLSAAIISANAYAGAGDITIEFMTATVNLSGVLPAINQTAGKIITMNGLMGNTTVTRTSAMGFRIFDITGGDNVVMNRLIMSNGNITFFGGGIRNTGTLTLNNCIVSGNTASFGGGILNTGTLTLTNCTVSDNTASTSGGGIDNDGTLTLTNSIVSGNTSIGNGGGCFNQGTFNLRNCTISSNTVSGSNSGGGIFNNTGATLTDSNSVIHSNGAVGGGGGIFSNGTAILVRTTVRDNTVTTGGGGGIVNNPTATMTATGVTLQSNVSNGSGSGIFNDGTLTLTNSIVALNRTVAGNGAILCRNGIVDIINCTVAGNTGNIGVSRTGGTCTLRNALVVNHTGGNLAGTIAQTTSVSTNGAYFHSPTNYHLLPNAPAGVIGSGTPGSPTPATDFIGLTRPASPTIGAYEAVAGTPVAISTNAASGGNLNTAFGTTGVSLNLTGVVPATASFTAQRYDVQPQGSPFITAATSLYYWVISTDATAIGGGTATFDWSGILNNGGVITPATVQLLRRDGYGAPFTSVVTGGSGSSIGLSGITSFSEFALGGAGDNPLPVEISLFTGSASASGVSLNWNTASETNNAGFSILRDNQVIADYNSVSELRGKGTTSNASSYSFIDATVEAGRNYTYQLRSHDLSGTVHDYPATVSVEVRETPNVRNEYALSQNYPNPFNPQTVIRFTMKSAGQATLVITDMLGRTVSSETLSASAGVNQYRFNGAKLASGTYFYQLQVRSASSQAAEFSQTRKMVLVK